MSTAPTQSSIANKLSAKRGVSKLFPFKEQKILFRMNRKERICRSKATLKIFDVQSGTLSEQDSLVSQPSQRSKKQNTTPKKRRASETGEFKSEADRSGKTDKAEKIERAEKAEKTSAEEEQKQNKELVRVMQEALGYDEDCEETTPGAEEEARQREVMKLFVDNLHQIVRSDVGIKTIVLENEALIEYLELEEWGFKFCRLCERPVIDAEYHLNTRNHRRQKDEQGVKEIEEGNCIAQFASVPGEIEEELQKEREAQIRRKYKRIKQNMITNSISHEVAAAQGKDMTSVNKKRLLILSVELTEKQMLHQAHIKDFEALEAVLKEIIKIIDQKKEADMHLLRRLKIMPSMSDICKRISTCAKSELKPLGRMLEYVIKIFASFSTLRENRNYMLSTNRIMPLAELLNWCLNRPSKLFYGISFLP